MNKSIQGKRENISKEKLKEMIAYIVEKYNVGDLSQMKLWKIMFFAEADFYQKSDRTITGVSYIKNDHGPTPDWKVAKAVLEEMLREKLIQVVQSPNGVPIYKSIRFLSPQHLSGEEVNSIQDSSAKYYRLTASQLRLLSHRDPVYCSASEKKEALDFSFSHYRDDEEDGDTDEEAELWDPKIWAKLNITPEAKARLSKAFTGSSK